MRTGLVLSTYNGERYIREQLDSLLLQSLHIDVVNIIDDASTDDTFQLVLEYIEGHQLTWSVCRNEQNRGWMYNFGQLLLSIDCDLVFPCDQDDIWNLNKIKLMTSIMQNHPEIDVLASTVETFYEEGSVKSYSDSCNDTTMATLRLFSDYPRVLTISRPGCTYCIRKTFIEEIREIWDYTRPHDMQLWMYAATKGTLGLIDFPLVNFRRHAQNASSRRKYSAGQRAEMLRRQIVDVDKMLNYEKSLDKTDPTYRNELLSMKLWLTRRVMFLEGKKRLSIIPGLIHDYRFYPSYRSLALDVVQGYFPFLIL